LKSRLLDETSSDADPDIPILKQAKAEYEKLELACRSSVFSDLR
jgi:hypothetical protein